MLNKGIPISVSLEPTLKTDSSEKVKYDKRRLFKLSLLAILISVCISVIAKFLIKLID